MTPADLDRLEALLAEARPNERHTVTQTFLGNELLKAATDLIAAARERDALRAQLAALHGTIEYIRHRDGCAWIAHRRDPCSCGLRQVLNAITGAEEEKP